MAALTGASAENELRDATVPPQGPRLPGQGLSRCGRQGCGDSGSGRAEKTSSSLYEFKQVAIPQHRLKIDKSRRKKKYATYCIRVEVSRPSPTCFRVGANLGILFRPSPFGIPSPVPLPPCKPVHPNGFFIPFFFFPFFPPFPLYLQLLTHNSLQYPSADDAARR